jgi:hypothetical protein
LLPLAAGVRGRERPLHYGGIEQNAAVAQTPCPSKLVEDTGEVYGFRRNLNISFGVC